MRLALLAVFLALPVIGWATDNRLDFTPRWDWVDTRPQRPGRELNPECHMPNASCTDYMFVAQNGNAWCVTLGPFGLTKTLGPPGLTQVLAMRGSCGLGEIQLEAINVNFMPALVRYGPRDGVEHAPFGRKDLRP